MARTGIRWVDVATLLMASATFIVAFLSLYIMMARPRIKLYFWDSRKRKYFRKISLSPCQVKFHVLLRNNGDFLKIRRPAATLLTAYIYFPESWKIEKISRTDSTSIVSTNIFQGCSSGRFSNRKYVAVPSAYAPKPPSISIVSYKEDILCEISATIPSYEAGKKTNIMCQMTSREGDLGVRSLKVQIKALLTKDFYKRL